MGVWGGTGVQGGQRREAGRSISGSPGAKTNRIEQVSIVRDGRRPRREKMAPGPALCGWLTEAIQRRQDSRAEDCGGKTCGRGGEDRGVAPWKGGLGGSGLLVEVTVSSTQAERNSPRGSAPPPTSAPGASRTPVGSARASCRLWTASTGAPSFLPSLAPDLTREVLPGCHQGLMGM